MQVSKQLGQFWRGIFARQERDAAGSETRTPGDIPTNIMPPLGIPPDDPILDHFRQATGVVELDRIRLDSPALREMQAAGIKLVVPLISQGDLVGLIKLGPRLSEQDYTSDDRRLLESLASQAAPALQVARLVRQQEAETQARERIDQQLRLARTIQQTLLPSEIPEPPGWSLDAYYRPAWEVGGDFYDFLPLDDGRLGIIIGDVTDKGVPSALVMATCRSLLRASAELLVAPGAVLGRVNELLYHEIPANMFVTCFYALLDPHSGTVHYANAGHDLPYLLTAGGEIEELRATGMPLGLMPGMAYEEQQRVVEPGDQALFYSDGLAEAHNPEREMFGFPRVQASMWARPERNSLIEHLLSALDSFTGDGWIQEDDVTLVTLERLAPQGGAIDLPRTLAAFEIASAQDNERLVIDRVVAAVEELGLLPALLERVRTAVGEAAMNAMEHGNSYRVDAPITIEVAVASCQLIVTIWDDGDEAMSEPETPDIDAKLAGEQSPRGWGLLLIRHMVDDLLLETVGERHKTELRFNIESGTDER